MPENQQHQQHQQPGRPRLATPPAPSPSSHPEPPPFQPDLDLITYIAKGDKPTGTAESPPADLSPQISGSRD